MKLLYHFLSSLYLTWNFSIIHTTPPPDNEKDPQEFTRCKPGGFPSCCYELPCSGALGEALGEKGRMGGALKLKVKAPYFQRAFLLLVQKKTPWKTKKAGSWDFHHPFENPETHIQQWMIIYITYRPLREPGNCIDFFHCSNGPKHDSNGPPHSQLVVTNFVATSWTRQPSTRVLGAQENWTSSGKW